MSKFSRKYTVSDLPSGSNPLVGLLLQAGRADPPCLTIQSSLAHALIHNTPTTTEKKNIHCCQKEMLILKNDPYFN